MTARPGGQPAFAALPTARAVPTATAAQMAEADRFASDDVGIPLDTLMENASRQIAAATLAFFGDLRGRAVLALAGRGNNGGDAFGALPYLREAGAVVDAFATAPRDDLSVLAGIRHDALTKAGVAVRESARLEDAAIVRAIERADVVLDGLLGYGASGPPHGEVARLILLATSAGVARNVVAVDIPSGLHPDHGPRTPIADGAQMRAALTVTLALPKPGLLVPAANPFVGELVVADIGIPSEAFALQGIDTGELFARGPLVRVRRPA